MPRPVLASGEYVARVAEQMAPHITAKGRNLHVLLLLHVLRDAFTEEVDGARAMRPRPAFSILHAYADACRAIGHEPYAHGGVFDHLRRFLIPREGDRDLAAEALGLDCLRAHFVKGGSRVERQALMTVLKIVPTAPEPPALSDREVAALRTVQANATPGATFGQKIAAFNALEQHAGATAERAAAEMAVLLAADPAWAAHAAEIALYARGGLDARDVDAVLAALAGLPAGAPFAAFVEAYGAAGGARAPFTIACVCKWAGVAPQDADLDAQAEHMPLTTAESLAYQRNVSQRALQTRKSRATQPAEPAAESFDAELMLGIVPERSLSRSASDGPPPEEPPARSPSSSPRPRAKRPRSPSSEPRRRSRRSSSSSTDNHSAAYWRRRCRRAERAADNLRRAMTLVLDPQS